MKQPHVSRAAFFVLMFFLAFPAAFVGCITDRLTTLTAPPKAHTSVAPIEKEIVQIKQRIADLRRIETQQRQIAVINDTAKSQGLAKSDGQPAQEEVADTSYMQAAAAEKEIKQLESRLTKLQAEKGKM